MLLKCSYHGAKCRESLFSGKSLGALSPPWLEWKPVQEKWGCSEFHPLKEAICVWRRADQSLKVMKQGSKNFGGWNRAFLQWLCATLHNFEIIKTWQHKITNRILKMSKSSRSPNGFHRKELIGVLLFFSMSFVALFPKWLLQQN